MKTFYADLPLECLQDLKTLTSLICRYSDPETILLYGNYAGDTFVPASERGYDLAVLTGEACVPSARDIKRYLYRHFPQQERHVKHVHVLTFPVSLFNSQVISGNWFFYRLRKEGVVLHCRPGVYLSDRKKIDMAENADRAAKAGGIFLHTAREFCEDAAQHLRHESLRSTAIGLYLAIEQAFRGCYAVLFGLLPAPMPLIDYQDSIAPFTGLDGLLDRSDAENNSMLFRIARLKNLARYNLPFDASQTELARYLDKTCAILELLEAACSRHVAGLRESGTGPAASHP